MDASKRFTVHHIEYEAEWETAFNLQLKLHDCISLIIKWCASDEQVLITAYHAVLARLERFCHIPKMPVHGELTRAFDTDSHLGVT